MIKAKVKLLRDVTYYRLEDDINDFLSTIDIRQIIKTEYSTCSEHYSVLIYYVNFEDIRDAKLDNILDIE
jgi:hypothetical protein